MIAIENLLLHKPPMRLIDKVLSYNETEVICEAMITPHHIFYNQQIQGIYHWVAIEIMAQSTAAMAGLQNYRPKSSWTPKIGFLMSVRNYQSTVDKYIVGTRLNVHAKKMFAENNVGVFSCHISLDDKVVATTRINAIEPDEHLLNKLSANK